MGPSFEWCVTPTRKNVWRFLRQQGRPRTVDEIRFMLDFAHGCVWPPSRVKRALHSLELSDLVVYTGEQGWAATCKSEGQC